MKFKRSSWLVSFCLIYFTGSGAVPPPLVVLFRGEEGQRKSEWEKMLLSRNVMDREAYQVAELNTVVATEEDFTDRSVFSKFCLYHMPHLLTDGQWLLISRERENFCLYSVAYSLPSLKTRWMTEVTLLYIHRWTPKNRQLLLCHVSGCKPQSGMLKHLAIWLISCLLVANRDCLTVCIPQFKPIYQVFKYSYSTM